MKIAVLGPGAIGGLLASLLFRKGHDVICIGTDEDVAVIRTEGMRIESSVYGNFVARPQAETILMGKPDVLFITVKAPHLNSALSKIQIIRNSNTIVVPLLNGCEHFDQINTILEVKTVTAMIGNIEVLQKGRGHIVHVTNKTPHLELASPVGVLTVHIKSISEALNQAGIETVVKEKTTEVIWNKLARLSVIGLLTAAAQKPIGWIRTNPMWRGTLTQCVQEVIAIANAEGVAFDSEVVITQIDSLSESLTTSLSRDIGAGVLSELDAIVGAVLRRGTRVGLSCPTMQVLFDDLRKKESTI